MFVSTLPELRRLELTTPRISITISLDLLSKENRLKRSEKCYYLHEHSLNCHNNCSEEGNAHHERFYTFLTYSTLRLKTTLYVAAFHSTYISTSCNSVSNMIMPLNVICRILCIWYTCVDYLSVYRKILMQWILNHTRYDFNEMSAAHILWNVRHRSDGEHYF